MRFGLLTPIVIQLPQNRAKWETTGDPETLVEIATHADALGYHHLTCSEHTAVSSEVAGLRGGTYWDPLATLSFLAAKTRQIKLATNVLVLGYHHPLALVKSYGTLDRLSGGRVILGVGVGSLEQEFKLLDAAFADRGARADDSLRAISAAWGRAHPEYAGEYFSFNNFIVQPHAPRTIVPIWVGGRTRRSLRRALELASGWMPFGLTTDQLKQMLPARTPTGFEVVLQAAPLDPLGDKAGTRHVVAQQLGAGATIVNVRFNSTSVTHFLHQMAALTELFPEADWTQPAGTNS